MTAEPLSDYPGGWPAWLAANPEGSREQFERDWGHAAHAELSSKTVTTALTVVGDELGAVTVTFADVHAEQVQWLWRGWLPRAKLVVLDGNPGEGKTTVATSWAACLSRGGVWPDGEIAPVADVIIASAEDGLADTIRPRLNAAGADPRRVHALTEVRTQDEDGRTRRRQLTLADTSHIQAAISRHSASLMIFDVLMAYMPGGVDSHRDQDVRTVLAELAGVAERTGCTILLLRHLNKSSGGHVLYRGGGSIGIIGAARAGMVVAPDPDDESRRVLAMTKSNLAAMPPALTYRLVDAPEHGCARVDWLGSTSYKASDLLGHREDDDERSERDEAAAWLVDYLIERGGEAPAAETTRAASKALGLQPRALRRARDRARITTKKGGFDDGWTWVLPVEGVTEGAQGDSPQSPDRFGPLGAPSRSTCGVCGDPMTPVEPGQTSHPTCRVSGDPS